MTYILTPSVASFPTVILILRVFFQKLIFFTRGTFYFDPSNRCRAK